MAGEYVRPRLVSHARSANVADGSYTVKLAVARNNELLGSPMLPFLPTVVDLGQSSSKSRARGYDRAGDSAAR